MVAMTQRLDTRFFFFRPQLSVCTVSALVLKVFWNGSGCHGHSVAGPVPSGLSNFAHSVKIHGMPLRRVSRGLAPFKAPGEALGFVAPEFSQAA